MDPTTRFLEMVNGPADEVDLTEGALALAAHARPHLDLKRQRARVDEIAAACAEPTLAAVRALLFDELGFKGDSADYYSPENSMIDSVLDRRQGLPITLSLLLMEVARRTGLPLEGVAMPGHFLVRDLTDPPVFIDSFDGGRLLDVQGCQETFARIAGPGPRFDAQYLEPVPPSSILSRMAANVVNAYSRAEDRRGMQWASVVRAGCPDVGALELAQLGANLETCAAFDKAAEAYERAAELSNGKSAEELRREAGRMRARLN